jgi:hypothetical protein
MSYYAGDSYTLLRLDTGISLVGATVTRILYRKPNGLKGFWTATPSGTALQYQLIDGDIDQHGIWEIQAYVEVGSKKALGKIVEINFDKPLNQ